MNKQSYKIEIAQEVLDDLRARLARTRWADEVAGAGWDYGTNLEYLKALAHYWQGEFDWRAQETALNRFDHFRAEIDGFGLHFIHQRGQGANPIPLLLTHGFPDSFYRFDKIIALLTAEIDGVSFDVVVPSLPGFGFSDRPTQKGMDPQRIADMFTTLMTQELGYDKFAAHGGDWGSTVTDRIALLHADALLGIHLTDIPTWHLFTVPTTELSQTEREYLEVANKWLEAEGGYAAIQRTEPQNLGFALNDSPAGLAAWLLDLLRTWSDCEGDLEKRFTRDELLTFLTIYWATQTIASSFRLYYETENNPAQRWAQRLDVPTGVAIFARDFMRATRELAERFFDIQHWTEMPRGGHFAAFEEPELLAADIREFFSQICAR